MLIADSLFADPSSFPFLRFSLFERPLLLVRQFRLGATASVVVPDTRRSPAECESVRVNRGRAEEREGNMRKAQGVSRAIYSENGHRIKIQVSYLCSSPSGCAAAAAADAADETEGRKSAEQKTERKHNDPIVDLLLR